jgi:hypothetical protein
VPSRAATTCVAGNKLVDFLSQILCVCVCVCGGQIPYPFSSQLVPFTLFKKDLTSYFRILLVDLDFCFRPDHHVFRCYKFERWKK